MAESPAQLHAETEKYQQKHDENPEGRYFVPLANAYRKLGEFDMAESLLREGMRRHPEYLSAHIVLGRTLADRGNGSEATAEFRHVLGIDPQNLIALRSLGELAVSAGKEEEAGHWYRELLAVDPMNEEARQALEELEGPGAEEPEASGFESSAAWWQSPGGLPDAAAPPPFDTPAPDRGDAEEEPLDDVNTYGLDWSLPGDASEADEPEETETASELTLDWDSSVEISTQLGGHEDAVEVADAVGAAEEASDVEPLTLSLDWQVGEDDVPGFTDAASDLLDTEEEPANLATGWQAEEPPEEPEFGTIEELAETDDHLVTETMAELYASQGFRAEAAEVYRELVRRRGEEPALLRRLAELESEEELGVAAADAVDADSFADSFRNGFGGVNGESDSGDLLLEEAEPDDLVFLAGADASDYAVDDTTLLDLAPEAEETVSESEFPALEPIFDAHEEVEPEAEAHEAAEVQADAEADEPILAGEPSVAESEAQPTVAEYFAGLLAWRPARRPAAAPAAPPEPEPEPEPEPFDGFAPEPEPSDDTAPTEAVASGPAGDLEPAEAAAPAADDGEDDDLFPWELPAASEIGGRDEPPRTAPEVQQEVPEVGEARAERSVEPNPDPAAERAEVAPPQAASAPADEDDDDLESFQTWLRSLKR